MKHKHIFIQIFFFFFFFSNGASGTTITVVNNCGFTVWPAISGSPVLDVTGFELKEGNSRSFQTPANWSGRLWARTGCTFNGSAHGSCKIGDCGSGEMECNGRSASPPMTVEASGGSPVYSSLGCVKRGCTSELNKRCPEELKLKGGGGCQSPCQVFRTPVYCCNNSLTSCEPTAYSRFFHSACPRSDDRSKGSNRLCEAGNYTVRFCPPDNAFSTIKVGSQLNPYDQLVSISGKFTLGFFGALYDYLGIWYTADAEARKVWVANPKASVVPLPSVLAIDPSTGNLVITYGGMTLMKITDVQAGPNPNVTATLEDTGNFRLINEIDKRVLWQSFDHPTNVLLPGMKLGYDTRTRHNWTLTSWLANDTIGSGTFTLSWEPINESSQRLMIRQRGQPYWTSGFLDNNTFEYMFLLDGDKQSKYILSSVYNNEERYFSYIDDPSYEDMSDPFPMWILTPKGKITNYNTSDAFSTPELCYGYNSSNGCLNPSLPVCRREDDYFSYLDVEFTPHMTKNSTDSNSSISTSDCFVKCWNDCNCVGFNSSNANGTGCVIWIGSNNFFINVEDEPGCFFC